MSVGVVLGAAFVVLGAVLLAARVPALGRVGRDRAWSVRLAGETPGAQALWVAGSISGSLGGVVLWHEVGLVALVVVVALVVPQGVVARVRRRREARG